MRHRNDAGEKSKLQVICTLKKSVKAKIRIEKAIDGEKLLRGIERRRHLQNAATRRLPKEGLKERNECAKRVTRRSRNRRKKRLRYLEES